MTVVNTYETPVFEALIILFVAIAVFILFVLVLELEYCSAKEVIIAVPIAACCIAAAILCYVLGPKRTIIEATFDDMYPITKVYEEYNVKETRGSLYILEEKK